MQFVRRLFEEIRRKSLKRDYYWECERIPSESSLKIDQMSSVGE